MYICFYYSSIFLKHPFFFEKGKSSTWKKIWALSPITRLLYLILTWLICALCMFIAYQYGLRGVSIRAMLPFCLVWLFLVDLPIREYLRKKISTLKAGEYLNILNLLLLIVLQFLSVFIMGLLFFLWKFFYKRLISFIMIQLFKAVFIIWF